MINDAHEETPIADALAAAFAYLVVPGVWLVIIGACVFEACK